MNEMRPANSRGRPKRSLSRSEIADAGIKMGLPDLSIVGVSAALRISHMTLYNHVASLDELKLLVAEEIFLRWPLRSPRVDQHESLEDYLEAFSVSMWHLVEQHSGIAPYLLREDRLTEAMAHKIQTHQFLFAEAYRLTLEQARWLFLTVSHVCVAVADTLLPNHTPDEVGKTGSVIELSYTLGVRALIRGAVSMLPQLSAEIQDAVRKPL